MSAGDELYFPKEKKMRKIFKSILTILTGNPKHILYRYYCPYCNHGTDSYEDMHDHLTYHHWMCVPAVDKVIDEIRNKGKEG